jgi:hypothetical protein
MSPPIIFPANVRIHITDQFNRICVKVTRRNDMDSKQPHTGHPVKV